MNDNSVLNKFTTIISDNSIIGNYLTKNKEKFTQYNESAPLFIKVYLLILYVYLSIIQNDIIQEMTIY